MTRATRDISHLAAELTQASPLRGYWVTTGDDVCYVRAESVAAVRKVARDRRLAKGLGAATMIEPDRKDLDQEGP